MNDQNMNEKNCSEKSGWYAGVIYGSPGEQEKQPLPPLRLMGKLAGGVVTLVTGRVSVHSLWRVGK